MIERLQKLLMELEKVGMQLRQELHLDGIRIETINKGRILLDEMHIIIGKKVDRRRSAAPVEDAIEDIQGDEQLKLDETIQAIFEPIEPS